MTERTVFQAMSRRHIVSVGPSATVHNAACVMTQAGCGSILIIDSGGALLGILTERDLMTKVLAKALDPATTPVTKVMTPRPQCVGPEMKVADAVQKTGANTTMIFVPPPFCADAIMEACDAGGGGAKHSESGRGRRIG